MHPAVSQEPAKLIDPDAGSHPTLEQVVEKLTVRAEKLGCGSNDCALLVMNFVTISGPSLMVDMKLTDQLANILAKTLTEGRIELPTVGLSTLYCANSVRQGERWARTICSFNAGQRADVTACADVDYAR